MNEKAVETKQRVQQHAGLRSQQAAQGLQVPHFIMSWGWRKPVENVRRTILRQELCSEAILEQQVA